MNRFMERFLELNTEIEIKTGMMEWFIRTGSINKAERVAKDIKRMQFIQCYCQTMSEKAEQSGHRIIVESIMNADTPK